jgi:hypothetical protein
MVVCLGLGLMPWSWSYVLALRLGLNGGSGDAKNIGQGKSKNKTRQDRTSHATARQDKARHKTKTLLAESFILIWRNNLLKQGRRALIFEKTTESPWRKAGRDKETEDKRQKTKKRTKRQQKKRQRQGQGMCVKDSKRQRKDKETRKGKETDKRDKTTMHWVGSRVEGPSTHKIGHSGTCYLTRSNQHKF